MAGQEQRRYESRTAGDVKALNGVELLLPGAPGRPKAVCFGLFDQEVVWCVFFFILW